MSDRREVRIDRPADAPGVAVVTLDRPPVNALAFAVLEQLARALEELGGDDAVSAVVLAGAGKHFCAGNDTKELAAAPQDVLDAGTELGSRVFRLVHDLPKVTVAALHGASMGSGFMLASLCDLRVADGTTRLGLPEITAGTFGGYRIARSVLPVGEARLLALTGEAVPVERAHALGFVQRLVDPGRADAAAIELARHIAGVGGEVVAHGLIPGMRATDAVELMEGHESERAAAVQLLVDRRGP